MKTKFESYYYDYKMKVRMEWNGMNKWMKKCKFLESWFGYVN